MWTVATLGAGISRSFSHTESAVFQLLAPGSFPSATLSTPVPASARDDHTHTHSTRTIRFVNECRAAKCARLQRRNASTQPTLYGVRNQLLAQAIWGAVAPLLCTHPPRAAEHMEPTAPTAPTAAWLRLTPGGGHTLEGSWCVGVRLLAPASFRSRRAFCVQQRKFALVEVNRLVRYEFHALWECLRANQDIRHTRVRCSASTNTARTRVSETPASAALQRVCAMCPVGVQSRALHAHAHVTPNRGSV